MSQPQNSLKILLIGDSCYDYYHYGNVSRISPEAPIPIFDARATWVYDPAMYHLVGTGRRWMGELFDFTTTRVYDFRERTALSNSGANRPVSGSTIKVQIKAVARSSTSNTKLIVQYGAQSETVTFPAVQTGSVSNYVQEKLLTVDFTADQSTTLTITYDKAGNNAAAMWLDEMIVDWETSEV